MKNLSRLTLSIAVFLVASCSGTTVIGDPLVSAPEPTAVAEPTALPESATDEPTAEPVPEPEPTTQTTESEPETSDPVPKAVGVTDDAEPVEDWPPAEPASAVSEAERDEKAERSAVYQDEQRQRFAIFHPDPYVLETEQLPAPGVLAASSTGNTVLVTTTVERAVAPDQPVIFRTTANQDTQYVHTVVDRADYLNLLFDHPLRKDDRLPEIPAGTMEGVRITDTGSWVRGLFPGFGAGTIAEVDSNRWYVDSRFVTEIESAFAFQTDEELWRSVGTPLPAYTLDETGATVRTATLGPDVSAFRLGVFAWANDETNATVTTRVGDSGLVDQVEIEFSNGHYISSMLMHVDQRGGEVAVANVTDIVQNPFGRIQSIPASEYSWTASGTFRDSGDSELLGPWWIEGRIHDGRYPESSLAMTAGGISTLAGLELTSTPAEQIVRRHGFNSVSYVTGLFPEMFPGWASSDVDPTAHYVYDPFTTPADIFSSGGLGDIGQWAHLRTVPEIVTLEGWDHARVTRGLVNPEYWNYRYRAGDGVFAWVASEDPGELFQVTIGATSDGRIERFQLETTDLDGGGLTFDITVDEQVKEYLDLPSDSPASQLQITSAGQAEQLERFDVFAAASREQFPVFDHPRRPQYLTVLSERIRDEPSGAYEPRPGEDYFNWSSFFGQAALQLADGTDVTCLALEDNEWRYITNDFERFWRAYEDGSSLDGQLIRFNTNGWLRVDIYASDGERHPDDPCS